MPVKPQDAQTTKRVSFVAVPHQRGSDPNKDSRLVNFIPEVIDSPFQEGKQTFIRKRPGLEAVTALPSASALRGIYYWSKYDTTFAVVGTNIYVYPTGGSVSLNGTFTTSTGAVGFTEFTNSTGQTSLLFVDGIDIKYSTDGSTISTVTNPQANLPAGFIPMPVVMDGYLFLAKAGTQTIFNSVLDDYTDWSDATQFIDAEMYPDTIQALAKNNNNVIAIGAQSMEYFYDAGIATGSPLQRQAAAVQQFGTSAPMTVVQTEKEVVLVGNTGNGGHTVWAVDGFKENEIGTTPIRLIINAEGTAITNATAFCIRIAGQKLYYLNLTSRTLVYSFDTKVWHEQNFSLTPKFATDNKTAWPLVLCPFGGGLSAIAKFNDEIYQDFSANFDCTVTTIRLDFDSNDRKRCNRLSLIGDAPTTSATVPIQMNWYDDDYGTLTSGMSVDMTGSRAIYHRLGMFRRRAFQFVFTQNYPLRLEGMELDLTMGQN